MNSSVNVSPIDLDRLRLSSDGDRQFELELLQIYIDDMNLRLRDLENARLNGDVKEVRHIAHTIKGASANVGAEGMRMLAQSIERGATQGHVEFADIAVNALHETFEETRKFVEIYSLD